MSKVWATMDGNEATAYVSYYFTEIATIYPITPSSPMAEYVDAWSANGKKNMFGQQVKLMEMQAESGAVGALHGAAECGALATSYTASQGLMLMIPTMYRLAGQLKPLVLHVTARAVGTSYLSIFGDHSDVMACRQTGFALFSSGSVQECMDLAGVAHLASIKGRIPVLHFFDGFRTSHELQKIEVMDYADLDDLVDREALQSFRDSALNPEHPVQRSAVLNPDLAFQLREASNTFYQDFPGLVEAYLQKISLITGREYHLFNYYGDPEATDIIIAMGSVSGAIREYIEAENQKGRKLGYVQVHLYRPFASDFLLKTIPSSVERITVLDRTKESGATGEPLYQDVCVAMAEGNRQAVLLSGRYGLGSKDVPPAQIQAIFANMASAAPKNHFSVGINDDVTFQSLPVGPAIDTTPAGTISCKFWGFGSDGTVGANKNAIKIIGDHTNKYVQAYFEYDTKKSGGVTISHLRFGDHPIQSTYYVKMADFIACHKQAYVHRFDLVSDLKEGGTFLLNCSWTPDELELHLPASIKQQLAARKAKFYIIDATSIAEELGMRGRINTVLQAAFFSLANIIPKEEAIGYMEKAARKTYNTKGEAVIEKNIEAIHRGAEALQKITVPEAWLQAKAEEAAVADKTMGHTFTPDAAEFVETIGGPANQQQGDSVPVSAFRGREDGTFPLGVSQYEKCGAAIDVPRWDQTKCIQCNQCALVCPHAVIRPVLVSSEELKQAPAGFDTIPALGIKDMEFRIQVSPLDCYSCGSCIAVCPKQALSFVPLEEQMVEEPKWNFSLSVTKKETPFNRFSVKGSQFEKPLLEFSGACAGCGETPYMKLLTQLFGDQLFVANATGCSQAWGAAAPCFPYTVNEDGHGPAWSNSLFENNAEFSLGMSLAVNQRRALLVDKVKALVDALHIAEESGEAAVKTAAAAWLDTVGQADERQTSKAASSQFRQKLHETTLTGHAGELQTEILKAEDLLVKKSLWMFGGDGWAYDIGYGGLDHVLATGEDVNVLIVDTEVYSNTGGQSSKATPLGAVAKFAASGKKYGKKDLGRLCMTYGHIYVAQVAMGADMNQLIKALKEAESYPGPAVVIAYAPCISHGIKKGMTYAQAEMKEAVASGYWHLYRFDPRLAAEGKSPFQLDSKEPTKELIEFLRGEVRYSALERTFPEEAERLFAKAETEAKEKLKVYKELQMNNAGK